MEQLIPLLHTLPRDRRLSAGLVRQLQEDLLDLRLSPAAPYEVAHHVLNARDLIVAGFFSYELAPVAVESAARAAERSLRELFVARLQPPVTFVRPKREARPPETLHSRPTVETVFDCFLSNRCHISGMDPKFHGTFGQLIEWCISGGVLDPAQKGWWEALQLERNRLAHGGTLVVTPNLPLAYVRETIWKINELFPDAETTAHDLRVKAKPRPIVETYKYG